MRIGKIVVTVLCLALFSLSSAGISFSQSQDMAALQKAAEQGDAKAQCDLGLRYFTGEGGVTKDETKCAQWVQKSAAQGHLDAQAFLGGLYIRGIGVPQDDAKGAQWLEKAAAKGHPAAQSFLGVLYRRGIGVPRDDAKAVQWLEKAAAQGQADAQKDLAEMKAASFFGRPSVASPPARKPALSPMEQVEQARFSVKEGALADRFMSLEIRYCEDDVFFNDTERMCGAVNAPAPEWQTEKAWRLPDAAELSYILNTKEISSKVPNLKLRGKAAFWTTDGKGVTVKDRTVNTVTLSGDRQSYLLSVICVRGRATNAETVERTRNRLINEAEAGAGFPDVVKQNTIDGYARFIAGHPTSPLGKDALEKMYPLVVQENTIPGYAWFINTYSASPLAGKALQKMYQAGFDLAAKENTVDAYNDFIVGFPLAAQTKQATDAAYDLEAKQYKVGMMGGLFGGGAEKNARAVLVKSMQFYRLASNTDDARKSGYLMIVERMNRLLENEFPAEQATVDHLKSEEFRAFTGDLKKSLTSIKDSLNAIQGSVANVSSLLSEQTSVMGRHFRDAAQSRALSEELTRQHRRWERYGF